MQKMNLTVAISKNEIFYSSVWGKILSFVEKHFSFSAFLKYYEFVLAKHEVRLRGLKSIIAELPSENLNSNDYKAILKFRQAFIELENLYSELEDPSLYNIKLNFSKIIKVYSEILEIYELDSFDWDPDSELINTVSLNKSEVEW